MAGADPDYLEYRLIPVLNTPGQIERWSAGARAIGSPRAAAIQIDTGMCRLGLSEAEASEMAADPTRLAGIDLRYLMSHLACAEDRESPLNSRQLAAFRRLTSAWPQTPASLANSSGIFLGGDYHFQLSRPGAALYGVNPIPAASNPMEQVLRLQARILQVQDVDAPQAVGYGATHRVPGPTRIATIAAGYADGYLRSLSNRGSAVLGGQRVAVVGRVSMDLTTIDVGALAREAAAPGMLVDLIGPDNDLDAVAAEAGTIGYELLTALGRRYHRIYTER